MGLKIVIMTLVMCGTIIQSESDNFNSDSNCMQPEVEHARVKRAKYFYMGHPNRLYRRPPLPFVPKGYYSATPPPGYYVNDDEPQYPAYPRPSKVSTRSTNEALGDGDISNLVKYLTKQDLDKIIEFAGNKERYSDNRVEASEKYNSEYIKPYTRTENVYKESYQQSDDKDKFSLKGSYVYNNQHENQYKIEYSHPNIQYIRDRTQTKKEMDDNQKFSLNGPYITDNQEEKTFKFKYNSPNPNTNYVKGATQPKILYANSLNAAFSNAPLETEETKIFNEINEMVSKDGSIFTDSSMMKEEVLPAPVNLRPELDTDVAYTNKVPTVVEVEAEPSSYQVEGFGDLPLMNYHNSKLHTVSSYNVPHYTVTSPNHQPPPQPLQDSPPDEPVPEEVAKAHSDAHLKAVRIWTHRSRGTAYTLYNDGTLALEAPSKHKRHP